MCVCWSGLEWRSNCVVWGTRDTATMVDPLDNGVRVWVCRFMSLRWCDSIVFKITVVHFRIRFPQVENANLVGRSTVSLCCWFSGFCSLVKFCFLRFPTNYCLPSIENPQKLRTYLFDGVSLDWRLAHVFRVDKLESDRYFIQRWFCSTLV